jgi:glycosyltransferase involved in cell wall biosynthesis
MMMAISASPTTINEILTLADRIGRGEMQISDVVDGFVSDDDLHKLYQVIDVAVFPSLYEPFGIVALEGMAAQVPVVVSDTGGLGSIVEHTRSGITTFAGNAESLSWGILEVLKHPDVAAKLAAAGRKRVEEVFNWPAIARSTAAIYQRILDESGATTPGEASQPARPGRGAARR